MEGLTYLAGAKRDGKIVLALQRALQVMALTHGCRITMAGVSGTLNYEKEMLGLRDALALLAIDPDEPADLSQESVKRNR